MSCHSIFSEIRLIHQVPAYRILPMPPLSLTLFSTLPFVVLFYIFIIDHCFLYFSRFAVSRLYFNYFTGLFFFNQPISQNLFIEWFGSQNTIFCFFLFQTTDRWDYGLIVCIPSSTICEMLKLSFSVQILELNNWDCWKEV